MESFLSKRPDLESFIAQAAHVFSTENLPLQQVDANSAFRNLQKTYNQYIKSWWEITSLETYIQQKIAYRGLRINLNPNSHTDNTEFIQGWQQILTESSLKLLDYLLVWERKHFQIINAQLEKEINEIQVFRPTTDFINFEARLQQQVESFQAEIRERKHRKFVRDKRDFDTNQVYNVKIRKSQQNYQTYNDRTYTDCSETDQSGTDESTGGTTGGYRRRNNKSRRSQYYNRPQYRQSYTNIQRNTSWQKNKPQEAPQCVRPSSDYYTLPPALSSVSHIIPMVPSPITNLAPPVSSSSTQLTNLAPLVSSLPTQATNSTAAVGFLGPPGIQLRDRERWGYHK